MGRKYAYASSASSSSGSDSESSSAPPPPRHRRRQQRASHHRRPRDPPEAAAAPAPQAAAAAGGAAQDGDKKKKKQPKRPPQESIDQIWERFSQKKFSKALAVLPGAPVPASTSGERGNELLSAGYERAAEECRRKVRKIISECRRVNTRYRDPGWDLDWDFKWEKGHCLNSLGKTKFDLCHANLVNPSANIPKGVKRVHEIFENPTFMGSLLPGDIKQGSLGNCWFVASLTGLANVTDGIKRICVEYDTKIGIYGFVFYRDGEWIYSIIDDKLYLKSPNWDSPSMQRDLLQQIDREDVERVYRKTYQTGSKALFFAQNKDQNETWVPLVEKAYAKAHGDFACLAGGWIGEALEDLSGGVTTELLASDIFDTDAFWENELSRVNQEFLFGCSTGLLDGGYGDRDGISEGHAYVLMEARTLKNGTRLCKLRNPWGKVKKGNWEGAWSDGSKEWTTEVQEELNHTFGSDSTFWISYEDLLRKYQHFDRTRLFRDPDWRSCQRWVGVEVPWKPQYNEKFHLKLTRETPLVLVLSQLDTRYFRGLQGQYTFRLQFRLHEEGRPGAEEYVVRSHGNYLMDRSVSVELPALAPGSYAAYVSVLGERDARVLSTEDVLRRECRRREENEKLAQVGQAYDLAHAKAAAHLRRLARLRKQAESRKASESRRRERRRNWEKRQTGRDIARKQKGKDDAKKAQRKAAKRAKAAAEAAAAKDKAEAEAEAEAERKAAAARGKAELPPADKGVQTETKDGKDAHKDADDVSTTSTSSSSSTGTPQYTPQETPKSESAHPVEGNKTVDVPPAGHDHAHKVSGGPPPQHQPQPQHQHQPQSVAQALCAAAQGEAHDSKTLELKLHYCACSTCKPAPAAEESDGYSSDSPVEDYELLYDSDDVTPTLRMAGAPPPPASGAAGAGAGGGGAPDSDDEDAPDPWNAIAVVGFRVYSKDEGLELRVVMEGGELAQDGMGNLGEADLDNAVSNAAGQREKKREVAEKKQEEPRREEKREAAEPSGKDQQVPEVNVIAATDTEAKGGPRAQQDAARTSGDNDKKKTAAGMAAYRTIIERQTSEYDRVMGKTKADDAAPADVGTTGGDEAAVVVPPPTADHNSKNKNKNNNNNKPVDAWHSPLPSRRFPAGKEKAVLRLRHRLQRGLVTPGAGAGPLAPGALAEAAAALAELEAHGDLDAAVLRATRIHQVLRAAVKMGRIPRGKQEEEDDDDDDDDDHEEQEGGGLSLWARVRALLDDYELTLATADDDGGVVDDAGSVGVGVGVGVVSPPAGDAGEHDGYFVRNHGQH